MIEIAVTVEAYEAIAPRSRSAASDTRLSGSETGKVFVWLDRRAMDRLTDERRRGEDLSDTIIRLAAVL